MPRLTLVILSEADLFAQRKNQRSRKSLTPARVIPTAAGAASDGKWRNLLLFAPSPTPPPAPQGIATRLCETLARGSERHGFSRADKTNPAPHAPQGRLASSAHRPRGPCLKTHSSRNEHIIFNLNLG